MRKINKSRAVLVLLLMYTMDTQPIGSGIVKHPLLETTGQHVCMQTSPQVATKRASMNNMIGNGMPCIFIDSKGYV